MSSGGPSIPVRVLLVDDEPDARLLLRLHLGRDARFEVVGEAADGHEAVERCEELRPAVVVLDLQMSGLDGLTALPLLRDRCPDARLAVVSAFAEWVGEEVRSHDAELFDKEAPLPWLLDRLYEFAQAGTR